MVARPKRYTEAERRLFHAIIRGAQSLGGRRVRDDRIGGHGVIERFLTEGDALVADGGEIRDPIYRVNVSAAGIHVYNRDGMTTATDRFDLYPRRDLLP